MSKGQVFFEIAVDTALKGKLREKVRDAAYDKIKLVDASNNRKYWHFPSTPPAPDLPQPPIEVDTDLMPAFIKNECLRELDPASVAHDADPVLLPTGSKDYYCIPDKRIICYHKYRLLLPQTGSYIKVSASYQGQSVVTDLLIVLTYETPQA